jgi:ParB/RepB/Spo0J family partition protein
MKTLNRKLHYFDPQKISFDKNNPRGLSESQIVNDPQFPKLVSSIEEYGILEPLIVKPDESKTTAYILIDGERRLRAALKAKKKEVPALIATDDTDGRILAYQVHMLRENWNKAAETKAIKKIISDLRIEIPGINEIEIRRRIEQITSHKPHELSDILKLAKYADAIIEKVISDELNMSYLVQIESSFIAPLKKHYPNINNRYGENIIREILIQKALDGKLVNTRFLMDKFKDVFSDTKNKYKTEMLLTNFLERKSQSIKETYDEYVKTIEGNKKRIETKKQKAAKKTTQSDKTATLKKLELSFASIKVTKKQQILIGDVRGKMESIGNSFTDEENAYIAEALFCLERHCFKAATLMIWSSGISRILKYIEKDLSDFNKAANDMNTNPKAVYKYFAKNFQKNATSIEDIRLHSNDRQLLCYLFYKKIITETECKKLLASYSTRCDCAHPTDIKLSPNEAISIFENIHDLILSNINL